MKVTILGCGGSGGVPLITGDWGHCNPNNPKNRRRRVSVLVEQGDTRILIDTAGPARPVPRCRRHQLDAVLYTHEHADHATASTSCVPRSCRPPCADSRHGTAETLPLLQQRFGYIFEQPKGGGGVCTTAGRGSLMGHLPAGVPVRPFVQDHGFGTTTTGYRLGRMAYSTDVVGLDDAAFAVLADLDLWIVDCLRYEPHPTHAHFDLTLSWIARAKPKRAILTHLNHMVDYDDLASRCPAGVEPGLTA
jgi:phosphoribosyl 1,2-cyclic phosphate phosphodiesterase